MPFRHRVVWAPVIAVCVLLLTAPALWNGFPLLQYDTGGYLARWYEGYLVPSRAIAYGLILNAGAPLAFWPVLVLQATLTVWVLALILRAHGFGGRPLLLGSLVALLSTVSTLPWLTAILLTDIFAGLGVLALYLLLLRADALSRLERIGLIVLVALSAATHSATLAVLLALMLPSVILFQIDRRRIRLAGLGRGLVALTLGTAMVLASNYVVAKQLVWTPGGFALSFGRMLQDGIVKKYLYEHCPDPALRLCVVKDQLPDDADVWFWGSELFDNLGRFAGLGKEMETIALACVVEYPVLQVKTAAIATARQLIGVHTGEGVLDEIWHTYRIIERYSPQLLPAMQAAHQQKGELSFTAINRLHYPLALLAMAVLPAIMWLAWRRRLPADIGELAGACALALMANAFVCGALSNPHDRYGARIVWLATLAVALALLALHRQRRRTAK